MFKISLVIFYLESNSFYYLLSFRFFFFFKQDAMLRGHKDSYFYTLQEYVFIKKKHSRK